MPPPKVPLDSSRNHLPTSGVNTTCKSTAFALGISLRICGYNFSITLYACLSLALWVFDFTVSIRQQGIMPCVYRGLTPWLDIRTSIQHSVLLPLVPIITLRLDQTRLGSVPIFDHGFLNINARRNHTKMFYFTNSTASKHLYIFLSQFSLLVLIIQACPRNMPSHCPWTCLFILSLTDGNIRRNKKHLTDPVRFRQISERIPAGRWGHPKDFAGPAVFLASRASQYVCGELLVVDGVSWLWRFQSFPSFFYR